MRLLELRCCPSRNPNQCYYIGLMKPSSTYTGWTVALRRTVRTSLENRIRTMTYASWLTAIPPKKWKTISAIMTTDTSVKWQQVRLFYFMTKFYVPIYLQWPTTVTNTFAFRSSHGDVLWNKVLSVNLISVPLSLTCLFMLLPHLLTLSTYHSHHP